MDLQVTFALHKIAYSLVKPNSAILKGLPSVGQLEVENASNALVYNGMRSQLQTPR